MEHVSAACRRARAEAAAWIVRLHGPHRTPVLEAAFRHWLVSNDENARQFERVTEVWDSARGIAVGGHSLPSREAAREAQSHRVAGSWMKHIAVAAVSITALGLLVQMGYGIRRSGSYQTGVGEQRVLRLEDGSRVSLNSDTRVRVSFTRRKRHLLLTRGEAFFEVTHAPERPFIVTVAGHDVTALGTSFLVRSDPDRTAVTLVEGKVMVSDEAPAGPAPASASPKGSSASRSADLPVRHERSELTLAPGERLIFSRDRAPQLDLPRIDELTAWRRGEVILDKMPLDEAIAEMNRYESEKLVIDSPQAGRLRVSGIYHTGDSQGFAQAMAQLYRLQVTERDGQIHLTGNPELPGASQR